jgi:hypothetical protein
VGNPKSALSWNAEDRSSARIEAVEEILNGISCRSRTNRCRRYLPDIPALSSNGNGAKETSPNKCLLVAPASDTWRLTASGVADSALFQIWSCRFRPDGRNLPYSPRLGSFTNPGKAENTVGEGVPVV